METLIKAEHRAICKNISVSQFKYRSNILSKFMNILYWKNCWFAKVDSRFLKWNEIQAEQFGFTRWFFTSLRHILEKKPSNTQKTEMMRR